MYLVGYYLHINLSTFDKKKTNKKKLVILSNSYDKKIHHYTNMYFLLKKLLNWFFFLHSYDKKILHSCTEYIWHNQYKLCLFWFYFLMQNWHEFCFFRLPGFSYLYIFLVTCLNTSIRWVINISCWELSSIIFLLRKIIILSMKQSNIIIKEWRKMVLGMIQIQFSWSMVLEMMNLQA